MVDIPNQIAFCVGDSDEQGGNVGELDVDDGVGLLLLRLLLQGVHQMLVGGKDKAACFHMTDYLVLFVRLFGGIITLNDG